MAPADPPRFSATDAVTDADYNKRWHDIWDSGLEAGQCFDASKASEALVALLDGGLTRGYDVALLASRGADATGLELSQAAVKVAERFTAEGNLPGQPGKARFVQGDFMTFTDADGPFDGGYDYTFLCALHPSMRPAWAAAWARLLKPGGELVTLMFPLPAAPGAPALAAGGGADAAAGAEPAAGAAPGQERDGAPGGGAVAAGAAGGPGGGGGGGPEQGPPWPLTRELYSELLLPSGFEELSVTVVPEEQSHPGRKGREMLGRWRRL